PPIRPSCGARHRRAGASSAHREDGPRAGGTKVQVGTLVVPDAGVWASTAKQGQTSPVIETSLAYYVFRADSLQPAGVPPIGRIRDVVAHQARAEKKQERGREIAREFLKRVQAGGTLQAVADSMKLPYKE